jgi:tRNA pseudouridine38-40 synthase
MPRYKLTIEYDGTPYCGWQKMPDQKTVQGEIEMAIQGFSGIASDVVASGRTDTRVHARGQVAHVDLPRDDDAYKVMQGINYHLDKEPITIIIAEQVDDEFHARFSCIKRHYLYRIVSRKTRLALDKQRIWQVSEVLDISTMQEAANLLIGHHDFSSFRAADCQAESAMKTLDQLDIRQVGDEIHVSTSARSFLYHQVRNMVGSLYFVGNGKWSVEDFKHAFEAKDRTKAGLAAPAHGLYFMQADY